MKLFVSALTILLSVSMFGCTGDKAKELMDTAILEEKQHNTEHARKLYQEIIQKYPDSPLARDARKKLSDMGYFQAWRLPWAFQRELPFSNSLSATKSR